MTLPRIDPIPLSTCKNSIGRISKQSDFQQCHKKGKRYFSQQMVLLYFFNGQKGHRLAIIATKKTGNAVVRNRWRRVIREWFRLQLGRLKEQADCLVIVKKSVKGVPSKDIRKELEKLFARVMS